MKVLVTGSSGKLGPHVVRDLERAGHEVVLFSRKPPAEGLAHLRCVEGDIRDFGACRRAVEGGFDAIQHLAAQPGPTDQPSPEPDAERNPPFDTTISSNIMGTYYLLRSAVAEGIKIFVMTGSNCALGHGFRISDTPFPFQYLPVDEDHPSDVEDSYSYSKHAGEELLAAYSRAYGMRTYAVRAAGITDAGRREGMARNAGPAGGWSPWLWAWVGSEDVASAHRLLMERAHDIEPHGVFFCNGDDTSALEPSRELIERFNPDLLPLVRDLDGHASLLSNAKLRRTVGWEHKTSWREHLKEQPKGD
jgi:nucleoside-diphosphate-sugar epimerase